VQAGTTEKGEIGGRERERGEIFSDRSLAAATSSEVYETTRLKKKERKMGEKEALMKKEKFVKPFKASATPRLALLLNPIAWLLWILDFLVWLVTIVGPLQTLSYYMQDIYSVEIDQAV